MAPEVPERGRSVHPSVSAQTESKLTARHVQFQFEPNLDINRIRDVEGNQVRLTEHRAPKAMVDRYAEQMKAGAIFPAIVVNDRYEIVDGNSRWMAARRNKRETIAAYVCYEVSALQARSLSVELNQSHGLSMTEDEIRAFVTSAVEEGQVLDAKAYSRMTGVKASTLARWVAVKHFDMRAARHGIDSDRYGALPDSTRAALQVAKLSSVFEQVTSLAIDARVPSAQLKGIITEANGAASEAESLAVVTRARADRVNDIRNIAAGFKSARRRSARSALHIGGLLRFEVADLLDVPPEKHAETYRRMNHLRQKLDRALTQARVDWNLTDRPESEDVDDRQQHDFARVQ
jgi:hypothetical protein